MGHREKLHLRYEHPHGKNPRWKERAWYKKYGIYFKLIFKVQEYSCVLGLSFQIRKQNCGLPLTAFYLYPALASQRNKLHQSPFNNSVITFIKVCIITATLAAVFMLFYLLKPIACSQFGTNSVFSPTSDSDSKDIAARQAFAWKKLLFEEPVKSKLRGNA